MLNFRYLFILFLFLSFNSYSELYCPDDYVWYCDSSSAETISDSFSDGFATASDQWNNAMDTLQEASIQWSLTASISLSNSATAASQNAWSAANSAWSASADSWVRTNYIVGMQNTAVDAANSAWLNNDYAASYTASAGVHDSNAAQSASNAAQSASNAAQSALLALTGADTITTGLTNIVNDVSNSLAQLQTNALNDVNNQIAGIVTNVGEVRAQALNDIDQYVSDSLNVDINIGDSTVVASALDTNTNALGTLTNAISNAGSQDNIDLINSLDGLSDSVSDAVPDDDSDVVSAIGDLDGEVETNTGILDNLYNFFTDGDENGEINNKSAGLFNDLKNSLVGASPSFASSGSSCPTWAFDDGALLVGGLVIDSHCSLIESIRSSLEVVMFTFFSIMGFRTVFSA